MKFLPILVAGLAAGALLLPATAREGDLPFALSADASPLRTSSGMTKLASALLKTRAACDAEACLDDLFRLQLVAGQPLRAASTIARLRRLRLARHAMQASALDLQFSILAQARAAKAAKPAQAFAAAFHNVVDPLDDKTADLVMREIDVSPVYYPFAQRFSDALKTQKDKTAISQSDARALVRAYQLYDAYRTFAAYAPPVIVAEEARRFRIEHVQVPTPDGASISVLVVRPRFANGKLPALLNFTIYADPESSLNEARRSAANGYIGVEGFTRGKMHSPDKPVAYEDDGKDADAVIDWIARQPWSDGRVGMYGGSYEGFTQWAAAKHLPKALKALMPSVSAAPGIDVPMEGNVFQTFVYYWPFYTLSNKTQNDAAMTDGGRWRKMQQHWYNSGNAYRDLPRIDGAPNPSFERWLDHPSYDAYWQAMIPYQHDFAKIDIPVLTTTGYYDGGQIGALYYYMQHRKYAPQAEDYLLIGPYDHIAGQRGTINMLGELRDTIDGYKIDPVAQIDLGALRYAWFDYVFRHGPKPAIIGNRVNFEVMGANAWRHVLSLDAMSNAGKRFYLTPGTRDGRHSLAAASKPASVTSLTVDLAERKAEDPFSEYGQIVTHGVDDWNGLTFVSAPFDKRVQFNGLFSADLDVVANKKDFDFEIDLYEQRQDGSYFQLSHYMARASYVKDRTTRHLLAPGAHTRIKIRAARMTSRQFEKGSRLVMVLSIIKIPFAQINYGTGKDVSDETIADAGAPLQLKWYGDSELTIPIWR